MPSIFLSFLELITGILLLFSGGEFFIQGAVALALILGIPQLVIGLTIVSLGTSAPELFVSINSSLTGSDSLALSNIVGSNIFNVMVVLGASALLRPLRVESRLVRRDIPLLLAVSTAVWGMAASELITWQFGVALIVALIINTTWEIRTAREEPQKTQEAEPEINIEKASTSLLNAGVKLLGGIFLLTIGSRLLIEGASTIAGLLGVSEAIIGLTIVSLGTSLPELITSLVAAIRGQTDLAIGNVIGSCLLNQLLVLGSCSLLSGGSGLVVENLLITKDIPIMVITTLACMPIFWTKGTISRGEGGVLLGLYMLYIADKIIPLTLPSLHSAFKELVFIAISLSIIIITYKTIAYWLRLRKRSNS
ncbi:calcium/sodium antiporter [Prochlorococcus sp. MIT 0916]|uniref:calcium/sodium antiporter n=1 Tax=Prochlorococcus sp. MIT 0916 TaxID=3082521 RepID=UPI0039B5E409